MTKKKEKTIEVNVNQKKSLSQRLDEIDEQVYGQAFDGFYQSRLAILIGQWDRGEAVDAEFRGVESAKSYYQLEEETGRQRESLKKWRTLYLKHPDRDGYIALAEEKAREWTVRALGGGKTRPELPQPELPEGIWDVLYADPPWDYGDKLIEGYGAAEHHYPSMTIEELCQLPVKEHMAENAVLFLWVTSPLLDECWPVIVAWGFEYKTSFVWDKIKHNYGHYNSVRHEVLLVCTRGTFLPQNKKLFDSVQSIERSRKHSEKPEQFRKIIEAMYPNAKYLELFARKKVQGWESYGNDASL